MNTKKLILSILMLLCILTSIAQTTLDYDILKIGYSSYKVIKPTFNNLKAIVDCSSNQFETMMKQYGYWKSRDSYPTDYSYVVYDNNSTDLYLYGNQGLGINYVEKSESKKHALIRGKMSQLFPKGSLSDLRLELYSYKVRESDNEKFIVKDEQGGHYTIELEFSNGYYKIHIIHTSGDVMSSDRYKSKSNSANPQVVTSVAGLDFGTSYHEAILYLGKHFGYNYARKGDYLIRCLNVMIGGFSYEFADFFFKDGKFVGTYFYRAYKLSEFSKAKDFREQIVTAYKKKYLNSKDTLVNGIKCYGMGVSMYYHDTELFPIVISLEKSESENGDEYYYVGVSYYNHLVGGNDDI